MEKLIEYLNNAQSFSQSTIQHISMFFDSLLQAINVQFEKIEEVN